MLSKSSSVCSYRKRNIFSIKVKLPCLTIGHIQRLLIKFQVNYKNPPVPCILWDDRLRLSTLTKRNIMDLITLLQSLSLSLYWKRVTKSLLTYLRKSYFSHYLAYLAGQRHCHAFKEISITRGNFSWIFSGFMKSIVGGRDVIIRVFTSTWFEWTEGSTLIFGAGLLTFSKGT